METGSTPSQIGARIVIARKEAGDVTQVDLAKSLGKGESTIRNYETGKSTPSGADLAKVAERLGADLVWLITGERQISTDAAGASPAGHDHRADLARAYPAPYADTFELTVYTHLHASAGPPSLFGWEPTDEDDAVTIEESRRLFYELVGFYPPEDMDGIRVKGHSGRRPYGGIEDGQIVLYQPVRGPDDVVDGKRYVLTVSEGDESRILVKRVQLFSGGGMKLVSDNPQAGVEDEILLPGDDCLIHSVTRQPVHIQFVGAVIWPNEYDDASVIKYVAGTLDLLVQRGYLPALPQA